LRVGIVASLLKPNRSVVFQRFVLDEVLKLAKKGVNVHVFSRRVRGSFKWSNIWFHGIRGSKPLEYIKTVSRLVSDIPVQGFFRAPNHVLSDILYTQSILEHVKELDLDVLYAHSAYPEGFIAATVLMLTSRPKPLLTAIYGYDVYVEPKLGYGIRRYRGYDVAVRWGLGKASVVVAPSVHLYKIASELLGSSSDIYLVSNGVDINRFHPRVSDSRIRRRWGLGDRKVVFALKDHTRWCGFEYLIAAAAHICRIRKDVVFIIGGNGELRPFYEALATKLKVRHRIIFTGWIPRVETPGYYAACDVFVAPSLVEEFGLTVTEAMATGKPVIASDIDGLRELVTDRVNGFLVPPKSVRLLADRILYLLENPEEAMEMGLKGRKTVERSFNLDDRVRRLIQIFEETIRSKGR